jgi:hypothetical protein
VGGYRDYFDDDQVARIDALVNSKLSDMFGYAEEAPGPTGNEVSGKVASGA